MPKFRKKPVVIEAFRISDEDTQEDPPKWMLDAVISGKVEMINAEGDTVIHTLEGAMTVSDGDWIIQGIQGELYPCKPDIFAETYEPAEVGQGAMCFGRAVQRLKLGERVARAGWNGKGMWLVLVPGTPKAELREGTPYRNALQADSCEILPHIDMWTVNADGRRAMLPGWLASQSDMLAEDWMIV